MGRRTLAFSVLILLSLQGLDATAINRNAMGVNNDPEQMRISLGLQPNSMIVTWVTMKALSSSSVTPQVKYGLSADSLTMTQNAVTNHFQYPYLNQEHGEQYIYNATLPSLKYNTRYYYQVGSSDAWSQVYSFKTFSQGNDFSYTIAIFGDLGLKNGTSYPYLLQAAKNHEFDIIFHIGDQAYNLYTHNGEIGNQWMREMTDIMATVPYMVIAGNHEEEDINGQWQNFSHYRNRFPIPVNNPYGDNQFYSFNVGPVHYFGISSEYYFYENTADLTQAQYKWLQQDLQQAVANRAQRPWIIGGMHRPFYDPLKTDRCCGDNVTEYVDWKMKDGDGTLPGLEKPFLDAKVDMVYWGHVHAYERSYPIANMTVYKDGNPYHNPKGIVYITTGAAGNQEHYTVYKDPPSPWSAQRYDKFGYTLLHVYNSTHMHMEQISAVDNGQVVDDVWITKDPLCLAAGGACSVGTQCCSGFCFNGSCN